MEKFQYIQKQRELYNATTTTNTSYISSYSSIRLAKANPKHHIISSNNVSKCIYQG